MSDKKAEQLMITKYDLLFESRMTRVETALENMGHDIKEIRLDMKSDFKWLLGLMIALTGLMATGFMGLFGLMAHGFNWF